MKKNILPIILLIIISLCSVALFMSIIESRTYQNKYASSELTYDILLNAYELNKVEHQAIIEEYKDKLSTTEEALNTALKNNTLVDTLINSSMGDWTVESILATRDKFDLIPYGSPFVGGHTITGPFGSMELVGTHWRDSGHIGVDVIPNSGNMREPIHAVMSGRVVTWGRNDTVYGNYLVIESLDGMFQIKFAHLSSIAIFSSDGTIDLYEGMEFNRGDRIARMGNTGHTTGPHVHMEYYMSTPEGMRLLNADAILEYAGSN